MRHRYLLLALTALLALPLWAVQPAPAPAEGKEHDVFLDHADRIKVNNQTHDVAVSGAVVLRHEDARFFADRIEFNTKTKLGQATGSPRFEDKQTKVTADKVTMNFKERQAAFVGNVMMVTQRQPEPAKAGQPAQPAAKTDEDEKPLKAYWEDRATITCSQLQYDYRRKVAVATGSVKAVQKDRTAYGDRAEYAENEDALLVTGNVRLENTKGETFRCDKVLINLKDDTVDAQGGVASHFIVSDQEEQPAAPAPAAKE